MSQISRLLIHCDDRFQRLIIGFNNIIEDHKSKQNKMDKKVYEALLDIFTVTERQLGTVLCEVRTAIQKMGFMYNVINPNIMEDTYKKDDMKDWIIFREYVNQLEYMNAAFGIFSNNIKA